MDKLELLLETFKGSNEDYPLFSLWKHFPNEDRDPHLLAEAQIRFYEQHKFDLMKISPHGRFPVVDYGCTVAKDYDAITGSTSCESCIIESIDDWETLEPLSVGDGELGEQLKAVKLIYKKLETLPKMMTIFSPLMVASKMDPNLSKHLRENPKQMVDALSLLFEDISEFAEASIDAGAEGIFLASQHLRKTDLSWDEVQRFEVNLLNKFIRRMKNKANFTVLHIHGQDVYFKETSEKIVTEAFNWHDRLTWPSLLEAAEMFPYGLLAGLDETSVLVDGTAEEIKQNVIDTLNKSSKVNNRIIIAPGCVIPITAPDKNIEIISKTVIKSRNR